MNAFQIVFVPICALAALASLRRARQGRSGWLAGLFWAGIWSAGALAIALPDLPGMVARLLGIGRAADLVSYLTVLTLLAVTRYFYSRHRRLETVITQLARQTAFAEAQLGGAHARPPAARHE
ncbi:MAG: DUF2304 domain-containing protein [Thermoguttaceae bacterium]|jgi:hypothetical protein|nr:DUF2304 domain-containing protein [Thermoguttaceae bacterium]